MADWATKVAETFITAKQVAAGTPPVRRQPVEPPSEPGNPWLESRTKKLEPPPVPEPEIPREPPRSPQPGLDIGQVVRDYLGYLSGWLPRKIEPGETFAPPQREEPPEWFTELTRPPSPAEIEEFFRPAITPEQVGQLPGWAQPLGGAAREMTSPAQLALLAATAGIGPSLAQGIRAGGTGFLRSLAAGALDPLVKGPFAARLAAEAGLGTAATLGGTEVAKRIPEDAPGIVKIGAPIAAGFAAGAGVLAAPRMARAGAQAARRAGEAIAPAARRLATEEAGVFRIAPLTKAQIEPGHLKGITKAGGIWETTPAAPAVKEPWQMTRAEYYKATHAETPKNKRLANTNHSWNVSAALREGKPVPPEVLAEYPDLAARAKLAAVLPTEKPLAQQAAEYQAVRPAPPPVAEGVVPPSPAARLSQAAEVPPALASAPQAATRRIRAVQQQGLQAPESVAPQAAKEAHIEMGAPDGARTPPPRRPTAKGAKPPPPDEPADILSQIAAKATQKERADQILLRLHEAAIGNAQRRVRITVNGGNQKLKVLEVGVLRRGQLVPREQDIPVLDELYNALHNPTKVASGEVRIPPGHEEIYKELLSLTDWEEAARLDFDPAMATVQDYFYRGWKPPEGGIANISQGRPLVRTPAFKKPRVGATYQEMREAGFEPLYWNPYEQWGLSRMQGVKYREQMELVAHLKGMGDELIQPHTDGPIPEGWRVPEVGSAFEGKPFATMDAAGEPTVMYTRRWLVPDRVANTLENIYGKRPTLGQFTVGSKTFDPLAVIDWLTFIPKRAKLIGSFFQQIDFLTRAGVGSWTRMADALSAGQPVEAVKGLARYPQTVGTIIKANFSPTFRQSLARQLDSTAPLVKGRPGVHLKGISEAGLSTMDVTIFPSDMDKLVRQVATETGLMGKVRQVARAVPELESAMRRGLFEGVYRAALITDIKNNIAPMVARMYPKLNDAQLNGTIARLANIKYSTIPASQSVIQNRVLRETLRRVFFSMGESEGLLRQAAGMVYGPNKAFWAKHWLGTYLFVIATAEVIHFASTGKPLPLERMIPISKDKWGPLPFGYNTRFASPTIPLKGRGGTELTLDVVGQMDTALRVLNPGAFLNSRESVPVRAIVNQASGTDFFGERIDDVGPGGIISRTAQLAQDLFSPIGAGGIMSEVTRRTVPGAEQVLPAGEARLGMTGLGIQATGMNLRAATREQRILSVHGSEARETLNTLEGLGISLGTVSRRFDTISGVKGGEVDLTPEQREQLQWRTDDAVISGLKTYLPTLSPSYTEEKRKELIQEKMEALRKSARAKFRILYKAGRTGESTTQQPLSRQWDVLSSGMNSDTLTALRELWGPNKKELSKDQEERLRILFAQVPLGQTNFDIWLKQTLRQLQENAANPPLTPTRAGGTMIAESNH